MSGREPPGPAMTAVTAAAIMTTEPPQNGSCGALSPPARKRPRLPSVVTELRTRSLDHHLMRATVLRDRVTEQVCELYFLQAGGNMMDYASWRKRPIAPQLRALLDQRRPPPLEPAPPVRTETATAAHNGDARDEIVEKAAQEAYVARRVSALARAGLWPERRLPRVLEPPRPKSHWDYLLEEMAWLAQDFATERKWKRQAARRCARAAQRHLQERALAAERAERARDQHLRRVAAAAARDVRAFWADAEKLADWKRGRRLLAARKEALDRQLDYIVDRTERYSRRLAATLHDDTAPSHSPGPAPPSDEEFSPGSGSEDDEETIAAAERDDTDTDDELEALRRESALELHDVLSGLPAGYLDEVGHGVGTVAPAASAAPTGELSALVEMARAPDDAALVREAGLLAAALQPSGPTLPAAGLATPAPRLLRHALREYQHVGLHWLATMHERRLNGILADEMGLGKTIQTIALLAHLALERADWGPHLVVAPTSVVLNWELEFKKWCPAFKLLTYYGTIKERKAKRVGWTKPNSFHVCITSYKLAVQDHQSFRRKRWKYLILDEAQNIKNFKSQRWQTLLNFQTERRLLLTGTPLQNSLLELWSLMHFLMPAVFASHSEFREWFAPVAAADDGGAGSERLVRRLHQLLRPFLLRRLKADVERQMPRKYDHVLLCRLSRRQRALYDDFMGRARTRAALAEGSLLSVVNVLMQLRKVCNHPDLFEPRPVQSPLRLPALMVPAPALVLLSGQGAPREREEVSARLGGDLATFEAAGARAFPSHRARHLAPPRRLVEELPPPSAPPAPPPASRLRLHLRLVARAPPPPGAPPPLPASPAPRRMPPVVTTRTRARPASPHSPAAERYHERLSRAREGRLRRLAADNERRCWRLPLYGADLREAVSAPPPPLHHLAPSLEERLQEARLAQDRYGVCVEGARAGCPALWWGAGGGGWAAAGARAESAGSVALAALWRLTSPLELLAPHPRLLQYDCGKLQVLARLLRRLRAGGHRALIFTQMTRVLDVLEGFLCMHGHTYLRLDGATRVDRRQPLVDRFNNDPRVFVFILSTRSGGVGLNLTGADTVIFYDSDWNPTMDAQAQDRAHRIGQTRDVHVYRLVSIGTVEENILRKAEQKRALGHRAIEQGRFTTTAIRDLLGAAPRADLERAQAAAEDEADVVAARAAATEQRADDAEFDEVPEHEPPHDERDRELRTLMEQLTPIERYAMRIVENSEAASEAERAAREDMERQAREWQTARDKLPEPDVQPALAALSPPASPPHELTYSGRDARSQMWVSVYGFERMPLWSPPTPPSSDVDGDLYSESWSRVLYRAGAAPDELLPPRARVRPASRRPVARLPPPTGLFERPAARPHARCRPPRRAPPPPPPPPPDWAPHEDAAARRALRLQRLAAPAAHSPNWEWAAEQASEVGPHRSSRQARDRLEPAPTPQERNKRRPPAAPRPRAPLVRLDALRAALARRRDTPKRRAAEPHAHNPRHAALLLEYGVEPERPPDPVAVAARRADRIARDKLKQTGGVTTVSSSAGGAGPAAPQRFVVAAAHPVSAVYRPAAVRMFVPARHPARHPGPPAAAPNVLLAHLHPQQTTQQQQPPSDKTQ